MARLTESLVHPRPLLRRCIDDTRGGVLAFSVVLLLFVLGTGGLILDFGRVWNSQSELQAFADHAALVAAGELDGNADAITRASAALAQLITDRQAYASQDVTLDDSDLQVTFLSGLPAADTDNDFGPFITADPTLAQYVRVIVNPHTVSTIFANALLTVSGNAQVDLNVGAGAVAGYTQFVCDITPLMFCPPNGMDRETLRTWLPGRQIRLKAQGFWGPVHSGCSTSTSTQLVRAARLIRAPTTSAALSGWSARSPAASPAVASVYVLARQWVRLIRGSTPYGTSLNSSRNDPDFAPAPNVIKGFKASGSGCINNNPTPSNVAGLPQAQCLLDENCAGPDPRFSSSQTVDPGQRADYVQQNYTDVGMADKTGGATTRYQMYLNEIANSPGVDILDTAAGLEESGRPARATSRRIRTGACSSPLRSTAVRCRPAMPRMSRSSTSTASL